MSLLLQDLKYASRRLETPALCVFAAAILGIGIGLNVAVFGIVDALLWREAPFKKPQRIVHIYQDSDSGESASTAYPAYRDIAALGDVFTDVSATRPGIASWDSPRNPLDIAVEFATSSYFAVLGLNMARGRWFGPEHEAVGGEMAAVVTDKAWDARRAAPHARARTTCSAANERFSFGSALGPHHGPMLDTKPKNKRYLEAVQLLLTFISTCAVAETVRLDAHPVSPPGYYAGTSQEAETDRDRRLADLARVERKRRELEQQATRAAADVRVDPGMLFDHRT